jgi:hypothetical protein
MNTHTRSRSFLPEYLAIYQGARERSKVLPYILHLQVMNIPKNLSDLLCTRKNSKKLNYYIIERHLRIEWSKHYIKERKQFLYHLPIQINLKYIKVIEKPI